MSIQQPFKWFDATEVLPDEDEMQCIVYDPDNPGAELWPAEWSAANQCFFSCGGWFEKGEVTKWMRVEAPTEGEPFPTIDPSLLPKEN